MTTKSVQYNLVTSILMVVIWTSAGCGPVTAVPTSKPTPTPTTIPTKTHRPTFTLTPTKTIQQQATLAPSEEPVASGTPLFDYETVPIPADAVWGMDTADRYIFTTRQLPATMIDFYQQNLPLNGWEVQDISHLDLDGKYGDEIYMAISQINGLLQGIITISQEDNDKLTYVWIVLFITD